MNSLLYTIRGYKIGDPAFTFDTESKGFDKSVWSEVKPEIKNPRIAFTAAVDVTEGLYLFDHISDSDFPVDDYAVYVNGKLTQQKVNNVTWNAGDKIVIESKSNTFFEPSIGSFYHWYVKSWDEPLPLIYDFQTKTPITVLAELFMGDVYIESVCNGFLDNNPQVTNVSGMFRLCYRLSYLPETLLSKLTHLNDASYFMTECGDTVAGTNLYIDTDADNLDVTVFYIPYNLETDSVGTGSINVHCKNESVAYNAFSSLNSSYINLIGY